MKIKVWGLKYLSYSEKSGSPLCTANSVYSGTDSKTATLLWPLALLQGLAEVTGAPTTIVGVILASENLHVPPAHLPLCS